MIHPSLFTGLDTKSSGISCQVFGLISSCLSGRRLEVIFDEKSSPECPINAYVPQGSFLGPSLLLPYSYDFRDNVRNTLSLKCCYLKIIHILHARYHAKIIVHILKDKKKKKYVCKNVDENEKT